MSRGTSCRMKSGRGEGRAVALGVGIAPAAHAFVQCHPYFAAVLPPYSCFLPLPFLGVALGGVFNITFSSSRSSSMSSTAYSPLHPASNTLASRG